MGWISEIKPVAWRYQPSYVWEDKLLTDDPAVVHYCAYYQLACKPLCEVSVLIAKDTETARLKNLISKLENALGKYDDVAIFCASADLDAEARVEILK